MLGFDLDVQYFQQDEATPHTARETLSMLQEFFGDRTISRGIWPPRSPDLTPPDYFLWGYLKEQCYSTNPKNLEELQQNIRAGFSKIDDGMLQNVFRNFEKRLEICSENQGNHVELFL